MIRHLHLQGNRFKWQWYPSFALGTSHLKRSGFFARFGRWLFYFW